MATPDQNLWLALNTPQKQGGVFNPSTLGFTGNMAAPPPTQQAMNVANQQAPAINLQGADILTELNANRNEARDLQKKGVQDWEKLLQDHLAKTANKDIDLSPLIALTDSWTGSKLMSGYQRPTDSRSVLETTAALQQGLQKARGALTDDEQQFLLAQLGLSQKASDAMARTDLAKDKMASQEKVAAASLGAKTGGLSLTPGQKTLDTTFAKDLDEWTSGGEAMVDKNLQRLREARDRLKATDNEMISGRIMGRLPDILRPEESLAVQQDVQAAAQGALRATLGAQFTEKEGERIMRNSYDPKLSPAENARKIDAAITELERQKQNKNIKAREFMQKGTIKDVNMSNKTPAEKPSLSREEKIKMLKARAAGGGT